MAGMLFLRLNRLNFLIVFQNLTSGKPVRRLIDEYGRVDTQDLSLKSLPLPIGHSSFDFQNDVL